ncbi:MAG TPA: M4 family metallopeptidase [Labilithrix sp.]|nr:M4 family metallopeptidase [Labilithrix sp.]
MRDRAVLLLLLAAGCAGRTSDGSSERASGSTTQATALSILEKEPRAAWSWVERSATPRSIQRPAHVTGRSAPVLRDGVTPYAATMAFVTHFGDAFDIDEPAAHFVTEREERDELGMTHLRLRQVERGVPVLGAQMLAHFDREGSLRTLDSTSIPGLAEVDVSPTLGAAEALAIAERHFAKSHDVTSKVDARPELVIYVPVTGAKNGVPALAYHLDLRSPDDVRVWVDYAIDAHSGEVVETFDKMQSLAGSGTGTQGDTKAIEISQEGSTYSLIDTSRTPKHISTYDAQHKGTKVPGIGALMPGTGNLPGVMLTSSSATSGWDSAGVDAHFYAGITYDYYKSSFNRKGIDDNDSEIIASVHVMKDWPNAQWDGKQMLYGDGDGERIASTSGSIDVVAHELTHGVTAATSKLRYIGQTGALNESLSDIFGALVEHAYRPDEKNNWLLAEDVLIGAEKGRPLRNMIHPHDAMIDQPAHMSEYTNATDGAKPILDLGGVHINSGIPNNAFYLMTMGGKNDVSNIEVKAGMGWAKSAQIWYRINTKYLGESSGFKAAAEATLTAADDLTYTQNEKNIIQCAWIAVGVLEGECGTIVPQPTEPGTGTDGGGGTGPVPTPSSDAGSTPGGEDPAAPGDHETGCSTSAGATPGPTGASALLAVALGALASRRRKRG